MSSGTHPYIIQKLGYMGLGKEKKRKVMKWASEKTLFFTLQASYNLLDMMARADVALIFIFFLHAYIYIYILGLYGFQLRDAKRMVGSLVLLNYNLAQLFLWINWLIKFVFYKKFLSDISLEVWLIKIKEFF